jgi:hypothetical protein
MPILLESAMMLSLSFSACPPKGGASPCPSMFPAHRARRLVADLEDGHVFAGSTPKA